MALLGLPMPLTNIQQPLGRSIRRVAVSWEISLSGQTQTKDGPELDSPWISSVEISKSIMMMMLCGHQAKLKSHLRSRFQCDITIVDKSEGRIFKLHDTV